jgi:hypothetical protein
MPHGAIARMENCPAQAVRKMVARQLADRRIDPAGDFARRRSATPLRPARDKFASQAFENAGAVDGMSGSRGVMRDARSPGQGHPAAPPSSQGECASIGPRLCRSFTSLRPFG